MLEVESEGNRTAQTSSTRLAPTGVRQGSDNALKIDEDNLSLPLARILMGQTPGPGGVVYFLKFIIPSYILMRT